MRAEERYYKCSLDSPLGSLQALASSRGVCRLVLGPELGAVLDGRLGGAIEEKSSLPLLSSLAEELTDYFAGDRSSFSSPVDLRFTTPFQQAVLLAALEIPYGETRSYGELAASLGRPGASRAVGGALSRNPISILVPCHRVLGARGRLGGYTGGVHIKEYLLELEGALRPGG